MRYKAEEGAYPELGWDSGLPERENMGANGHAQGREGEACTETASRRFLTQVCAHCPLSLAGLLEERRNKRRNRNHELSTWRTCNKGFCVPQWPTGCDTEIGIFPGQRNSSPFPPSDYCPPTTSTCCPPPCLPPAIKCQQWAILLQGPRFL